MKDNNLIQDADQKLADKNLSKGAMGLSTECFKDILKLSGVDYIG